MSPTAVLEKQIVEIAQEWRRITKQIQQGSAVELALLTRLAFAVDAYEVADRIERNNEADVD